MIKIPLWLREIKNKKIGITIRILAWVASKDLYKNNTLGKEKEEKDSSRN